MNVALGQSVTVIGQSFDGGLVADNYLVVGLIRFGVTAMDKKMVLINLADAQSTFYMDDMVTDWLGYLPSSLSFYHYVKAKKNINSNLNTWRENPPKDWAKDDQPIVLSILDQQNMGSMVKTFTVIKSSVVGIFTFFNDSCSLERRCS